MSDKAFKYNLHQDMPHTTCKHSWQWNMSNIHIRDSWYM